MADGNKVKETNFICKMIGLNKIIITHLSQLWCVVFWETLLRGMWHPPEYPRLGEHWEAHMAAMGVLLGVFWLISAAAYIQPLFLLTCFLLRCTHVSYTTEMFTLSEEGFQPHSHFSRHHSHWCVSKTETWLPSANRTIVSIALMKVQILGTAPKDPRMW